MEHTTEEVSRTCASERIHKIQKRIRAIKSSEKIGVKYMQAWEEKIMERNEAREEGIREGHASGLKKDKRAGTGGGLQKLEELIKRKSKRDILLKRSQKCWKQI